MPAIKSLFFEYVGKIKPQFKHGAVLCFRIFSQPPLCYFATFSTTNRIAMSLDRSDIDKIAQLARLALAPENTDRLAVDLSNILALVAQMDAVDTSGVLPMAHPLHMTQRLRPDQPTESDQRERFQELAPLTDSGLYLVPKVID
jgi:aspartyl-tRNA(Asn)/glutamyl-tRNA(Gln) amidotransferase subunit C